MMTVYPYAQLGAADHGWLKARYHFSFAHYHNPKRLGFGQLLVINDDIIEAGRGFAAHPHRDMEIITYVREGAITHEDSMGNRGRTGAGDVQVMSAGTGVIHAEHNRESVATRLYQIWIAPRQSGVAPRWDAAQFPKQPVTDALPVLVSGQARHAGSGALMIHQDAAIYGGIMKAGTTLTQAIAHQAYVLASEGAFIVNGVALEKGDGAEIIGEKTLTITATHNAELLVIDVPDQ